MAASMACGAALLPAAVLLASRVLAALCGSGETVRWRAAVSCGAAALLAVASRSCRWLRMPDACPVALRRIQMNSPVPAAGGVRGECRATYRVRAGKTRTSADQAGQLRRQLRRKTRLYDPRSKVL